MIPFCTLSLHLSRWSLFSIIGSQTWRHDQRHWETTKANNVRHCAQDTYAVAITTIFIQDDTSSTTRSLAEFARAYIAVAQTPGGVRTRSPITVPSEPEVIRRTLGLQQMPPPADSGLMLKQRVGRGFLQPIDRVSPDFEIWFRR
jgi:hypothetical protein